MSDSVLLLSCHLAGSGHLVRMQALAAALAEAGVRPVVVSGGRPLAHLDGEMPVVQLPPLAVRDGDYTRLLQPDGAEADAAYLDTRRAALEAAIRSARPAAIVTELFPLGRRRLAAEFEAAIASARALDPSLAVLSSVRDIPEPPSKPKRVEEARARLATLYDGLMVHGDPAFLPLSATWPLDPAPVPVHHTGYVAAPAEPLAAAPGRSVLVSGGGGALGDRLMGVAAEAAARSSHRWHLLTGGATAAETAARLAPLAGPLATVEPARPDYRRLLAEAGVSVSLCGYNTALDLAGLDTPAILVPFEEGGEREQRIRAERLAEEPGFTLLRETELTPERLNSAVDAALKGPRRPPVALRRDGAARAAEIVLAAIAAKREERR